MKLQKCNVLISFVFLIIVMPAYGMEQNHEQVVLQAKVYNRVHPLICLSAEIQQQIIFPCGPIITQMAREKADELKEAIKTFFICTRVCTYSNENLKLPWASWGREKKNEMLRYVINHMGISDYKTYFIIPLALVFSGADADTRPNLPTLLHSGVYHGNGSAIAMLLNHKADPYQVPSSSNMVDTSNSDRYVPICFKAPTIEIAQLFLEKIDKSKLLGKSAGVCIKLLSSSYSLEFMKFWLDYGVDISYRDKYGGCLLHHLVDHFFYKKPSIDTFVKKGELLLSYAPEMVNTIDMCGRTPIDEAVNLKCVALGTSWGIKEVDGLEKFINMFEKHGGKTAQELMAQRACLGQEDLDAIVTIQ